MSMRRRARGGAERWIPRSRVVPSRAWRLRWSAALREHRGIGRRTHPGPRASPARHRPCVGWASVAKYASTARPSRAQRCGRAASGDGLEIRLAAGRNFPAILIVHSPYSPETYPATVIPDE